MKHVFELNSGAIFPPKESNPHTFMRHNEMAAPHWVRFILISPLKKKPYLWTHTDSLALTDILISSLIPCPFKGIVDLSSTILRVHVLTSDRLLTGRRLASDEHDRNTTDIPLDPFALFTNQRFSTLLHTLIPDPKTFLPLDPLSAIPTHLTFESLNPFQMVLF